MPMPAFAKNVRALFIGNSYIATNDLPGIIRQMALASGDTLVYEQNTPGGYTLQQHTTNATTLNLIAQGNWDVVILQEQSQLPSFPDAQVAQQVYPYAARLDSMIKASNPCATTLMYMTWGRKNGDAQNCAGFPVVCTYAGMDSMLQLRYDIMAEDNNAGIAPVAKIWRALRSGSPGIDLYMADESHPSAAGSFAAACTFYAVMFEKDPATNTYNYALGAQDAAIIKNTAQQVVYDSLQHWGRYDDRAIAGFSYTVSGPEVHFTDISLNGADLLWDFGDNFSSTLPDPVHTYTAPGTYEVRLLVTNATCAQVSTHTKVIQVTDTSAVGISDPAGTTAVSFFPNPTRAFLNINAETGIRAVSIHAINGRSLYSDDVAHRRSVVLSTVSLTPGTYIVSILLANGATVVRTIFKE